MVTGLGESRKTFSTDVVQTSHDSGVSGQLQNSSEIRDCRSGWTISSAFLSPMIELEVLNRFL